MRQGSFRKRQPQAQAERTGISVLLRDIARKFEAGESAQALRQVNEALAAGRLGRHDQARVIALTADHERRQGRREDAARFYMRAAEMCLDHPRLWLRPLVGQVQTWLGAGDVKKARMMARHACDVAESKFRLFDAQARKAPAELRRGGVVTVWMRPPRPSVVATQMGNLFLEEGELEAAEEFYERATTCSQHGASGARLGLARVALAKGDAKQALQLAEKAIRMGRYGSKTLGAWSVVIAARRRLGGGRISERLIGGLKQATASVRARAMVLIVSELRRNGMPQWREWAVRWLEAEGNAFPAAAAEMKKMILASWKAMPEHAEEKWAAAQRLLATPGLAPKEWLAGAKQYVRWGLELGKNIDLSALVRSAGGLYGEAFEAQARHGLALSCMLARQHDWARNLLEHNVTTLPAADPMRGRSVWALARMESGLGEYERAANLYRLICETEGTPARFRLQARLLWIQNALQAGERKAPHILRDEIAAALVRVDDPFTRMDVARQVRIHAAPLRGWSEELFNDAKRQALAIFESLTDPGEAAGVLLKVARRQVYDFGQGAEATRYWEGLPDEKKTWMWSQDKRFWEYLGCLMRAYVQALSEEDARAFAEEWLGDAATPTEGGVQIGIPAAEGLIGRKRFWEGMALIEEIVRRAPRHRSAARGWYWKALVEHKRRNRDGRQRCCRALREAQGDRPSLLSEWELDARALLLMAGLVVSDLGSEAVNYRREFLEEQKRQILRDLERIP